METRQNEGKWRKGKTDTLLKGIVREWLETDEGREGGKCEEVRRKDCGRVEAKKENETEQEGNGGNRLRGRSLRFTGQEMKRENGGETKENTKDWSKEREEMKNENVEEQERSGEGEEEEA